jgi:hypothetical protein
VESRRGRNKTWTAIASPNRRWFKALARAVKRDLKAAGKLWLPWWAVFCVGIVTLLAAWLFDFLGRYEFVRPALATAGVLPFAVYLKRNLIHRAWFWGTMTTIGACHVAVILLVSWTTSWVPARTTALFVSADLVVILALVAVAGRFFDRSDRSD